MIDRTWPLSYTVEINNLLGAFVVFVLFSLLFPTFSRYFKKTKLACADPESFVRGNDFLCVCVCVFLLFCFFTRVKRIQIPL